MPSLHSFVCFACRRRVELTDGEVWMLDGVRCPPYWAVVALPVGAAPSRLRGGPWIAPCQKDVLCKGCLQTLGALSTVPATQLEAMPPREGASILTQGESVEGTRQLLPAKRKRARRRAGSGKRK